MATACIAQVTFGFEPKGKPVVPRFDQPHASSDGGAILLKSVDTHLGLTKRLAECLVDGRQPGKIRHQVEELLLDRRREHGGGGDDHGGICGDGVPDRRGEGRAVDVELRPVDRASAEGVGVTRAAGGQMRVERTVHIAAPPEAVYDIVMDPSRLKDWVTVHHQLEGSPKAPLKKGSQVFRL